MRLIKASGAAIVLLAVLLGPPWALIRFIGNPYPTEGISLSAPLSDDAVIAILAALVWVLWLQLAACILAEVAAAASDDRVRIRVRFALPVQQQFARRLVAALIVLVVATPLVASVAHAAAPTPGTPGSNRTASAQAHPAPAVAAQPTTDIATGDSSPGTQHIPHQRYDTVTVMRLDSLWSIAERLLGDGDRWPAIASLNEGRVMNDGTVFASADHIRPGWQLRVPAVDPPSRRTDHAALEDGAHHQTAREVVVQPGDTLSQIALDEMGDATDYPMIAEASKHITQPDGHHLTDPDVIDVGWTLLLPATKSDGPITNGHQHHLTQKPTREPTPDSTQEPDPEPTQEPGPEPARAHAGQSGATDQEVSQHEDETDNHVLDASWVLPGLTGAGALLAGALLLGLRRRRRAQVRSRRPGRAIAAPSAETAPAEMTINAAGSQTLASVEFADQALRRLAEAARIEQVAMPPVAALELTAETITLHLSAPAEPMPPWQATPDRLHWHCTTPVSLDHPGPAADWVEPPYPMLVTVGQGADGDRWMLNLEELGVIHALGDASRLDDFVRHLAAQLAVNPWSQAVAVDCVGVAPEVESLGDTITYHSSAAGTVSATLDEFAEAAEDTRHRVAHLEVADVPTARSSHPDDEVWPARALLIAGAAAADPAMKETVEPLLGKASCTGAAIVIAGDETTAPNVTCVLRLTTEGRVRIDPQGLDLVAVGLTSEEAQGCAVLYGYAETLDDVEVPVAEDSGAAWEAFVDQAGAIRQELTLTRHHEPIDEPATTVLEGDDEEYVRSAPATIEDLEAVAPMVPDRVLEEIKQVDPDLDADLQDWFDTDCRRPKLTLLGPVQVRTHGKPLARYKAMCIEIVAFLALRSRRGSTRDELAEALGWADPGRVRKYIDIVRQWLGLDPETGEPYLPHAAKSEGTKARGVYVYEISPDLLTDLDLFRRLRARGTQADLVRALKLVSGRPFDQLRTGGWAWLHEGERHDLYMTAAVADVAFTVVTCCLKEGDLPGARAATEIAMLSAPDEHVVQLCHVAITTAEGDQTAASRILLEEVCNRAEAGEGPTDLPERTEWIINNHGWLSSEAG